MVLHLVGAVVGSIAKNWKLTRRFWALLLSRFSPASETVIDPRHPKRPLEEESDDDEAQALTPLSAVRFSVFLWLI